MNPRPETRTNRKPPRRLLMLLAWAILTLTHPDTIPSTWADGCYFPTKAIRKIPDIEAQRAILHWNNGVETLIIASSLDSESQQLGWIIPLPSVPDTMEKSDPGTLKTLNYCVQPRITHDLWQEAKGVTVLAGVVLWVISTFLFRRQELASVLLLLLVMFILSGMLLSAGGGAVSAIPRSPSSVRVEKSARVGAYNISVLSASNPQDLNAWLDANNLAALPDAAVNIVADYIKQKWVFAAIQLVREQAGPNTPHPVRLSFKSSEVVYPMRLTALAGGDPYFELFVIADQRADCNQLTTEFSDQFKKQGGNYHADPAKFHADTSRTAISHPETVSLMWDNCVLTKLSGRIPSAQMTNDLQFTWRASQPYQQHFFTTTGAAWTGYILFVAVTGLLITIFMIRNARRIREPNVTRVFVRRSVLPIIGIGMLIAGVLYLVIPKLPADQVQLSRRWRSFSNEHILHPHITETLDKQAGWTAMTEDELAAIILEGLSGKTNSILGEEFLHESSPGNFTLHKADDKLQLTFYDRDGRPRRAFYPPK